MAVYSVNQATHLYVLNGTQETAGSAEKGYIRYSKLGAKGDLATDIIDLKKVISVTETTSTKLAPKVKKYAIQVTGATAGSYVMRVIINNYFSESPSGSYIKHASAYVQGGDNANKEVAEALVKSLNLGLKRDIEPAFKVVYSGDSDTFTIIPLATEWVLGRKATTIPEIIIELVPTDAMATKATWATITPADATTSEIAGERNLGAEQLADYEYFCLGERGDQYRGINWPNNVETKGQIDPTKNYNIVTVHYYEDLGGEAVQKSEKTVVFASTSSIADVATVFRTNL